MAIVAQFKVSGCSAEKYDAVIRELGPAASPPGQIYHISYGSHDNIQVIDVFDSPQSLENFGKTLAPILAKHGISAEPQVSEVYNIIKP
jgi:hypothetical protein